jgi:hypothetical protein
MERVPWNRQGVPVGIEIQKQLQISGSSIPDPAKEKQERTHVRLNAFSSKHTNSLGR